MLNADKDVKTKETAANKVMEAADKARNKKYGRTQKNSVNRINLFLGSKGGSKTMISTILSICRMLACVDTSVIIFKRGLSI